MNVYKGMNPGEGGRKIGCPGDYENVDLRDKTSLHPSISPHTFTAYDVSTPTRFEDLARDFVENSQHESTREYVTDALRIMTIALISIGYEKGIEILDHGYMKSVNAYRNRAATSMSEYTVTADVSTPARFEDAANDFVAKNESVIPKIYKEFMFDIMGAALRSVGYDKAIDILDEGYNKALIRQHDKVFKR